MADFRTYSDLPRFKGSAASSPTSRLASTPGLWYGVDEDSYMIFGELYMVSVTMESTIGPRINGHVEADAGILGKYRFDFVIKPKTGYVDNDIISFLGRGSEDLLTELTAFVSATSKSTFRGRWSDPHYGKEVEMPPKIVSPGAITTESRKVFEAYAKEEWTGKRADLDFDPYIAGEVRQELDSEVIIKVLVGMLGGSVTITDDDVASMGTGVTVKQRMTDTGHLIITAD